MKAQGNLTTEQLVAQFAEISQQQASAVLRGNTTLYNRLYRQLNDIFQELRVIGPEARRALIPLLHTQVGSPYSLYEAAQIRYNAAVELKAVAPDEARAALEDLAAHGPLDYKGMAGMSLEYDEMGISKPT